MSARDHGWLRAGIVVAALLLGLSLMAATAHAQPQDLPQHITCDQVLYYADQFNMRDTWWNRKRAKALALVLGFRLTDAQLDAAAKCVREARGRQ